MLVLGGINHSRGAAKRAYAQVKLRPLKKQSDGTDKGCPAARVLRAYWLDESEVTAPPFSIF